MPSTLISIYQKQLCGGVTNSWDHSTSCRADQHAHLAGEFSVAVGQQKDIFRFLGQPPLIHHEGVVDGQANNLVDAQSLEFVMEFLVAREVRGRASRRERTGQGEHHHALAVEYHLGRQIFPFGWIGTLDIFVADAGLKNCLGNLGHNHLLCVALLGLFPTNLVD